VSRTVAEAYGELGAVTAEAGISRARCIVRAQRQSDFENDAGRTEGPMNEAFRRAENQFAA